MNLSKNNIFSTAIYKSMTPRNRKLNASLDQSLDQSLSHISEEEEEEKKGCFAACSSSVNALVLLFALSVHAIFEGVALGLASDFSTVLSMTLGLLFHKGPAAMSLGIALGKKFNKSIADYRKATMLLVSFSLATPTGITIGLILSSSNSIMEVVFNSIAGGTFIYIAASEVIVEEFSLRDGRWTKMLAYMVGIAIIASLWVIEQ